MNDYEWTEIGREIVPADKRESMAGKLDRLQLQTLPVTLGMMQGEGIKGIIREFRIPNVSHVGDSFEAAPFGLYGIRARYADGTRDLFFLDSGDSVTPIASRKI